VPQLVILVREHWSGVENLATSFAANLIAVFWSPLSDACIASAS
jgi:hypothetical protein